MGDRDRDSEASLDQWAPPAAVEESGRAGWAPPAAAAPSIDLGALPPPTAPPVAVDQADPADPVRSPTETLSPEGPRSWRKRLEGGSKLATAGVQRSAGRLKGTVLSTGTGQRAAGLTRAATEQVDGRMEGLAATPTGQKVGTVNKRIGSALGKIPGVGMVGESTSIQNGVDVLTEALKEKPKDPERLLHLALALQRTERDMAQYRVLKTLTKPQSLVSRTVMRKAMRFGNETGMSTREKLLRAAFQRSMAIKKAQPGDGANLHLLARIYLVQQQPETARKLGRLALAAGFDHPGDAYVTLAVVEELAGDHAEAVRYGRLAVDHGSTLGYQVLADRAMEDEPNLTDKVTSYERWASMVEAADEERYYGVVLTPNSMDLARRLVRKQKTKAVGLKDSVGGQVARMRESAAEQGPRAGTQADVPATAAGDDTGIGSWPAAWYDDPLGRHQHRYWDGATWTEHVADAGTRSIDDPGRP